MDYVLYCKLFLSETLTLSISMSLILKHSTSSIYVVFAGISASLSSLNVEVFLFLDAFLLFLLFLVVFFYRLSFMFILKENKKQ